MSKFVVPKSVETDDGYLMAYIDENYDLHLMHKLLEPVDYERLRVWLNNMKENNRG